MQKKYIIIACILVIYVLVMVLIFGVKKETITDNTYLVIGENTRWEYKDKKWSNLEIQDEEFDKRKFEVYKDQIYKGSYYLQNYNDTWYFFDENGESHDLYGKLFAYSSKNIINVSKFNTETPTLSEINNLLSKYNIIVNDIDELAQYQKISYDFDNDGVIEFFYSFSNLMTDSNMKDFSIVLYANEDKIYEIINKIDNPIYIYEISNIIDFNLDGNYEIIIEHKKPMNPAMNCHSMYKLNKGKYELLKSCG